MEDAVDNYKLKINKLLKKLSETKNQIDNTLDLNKLMIEFWQQEEKEVESTLLTLPILMEWLKQTVGSWNSAGFTPQSHIISFTLDVASLLSKNQERFDQLNNNNFFIRLIRVLKVRQLETTTIDVKLSYIKLLLSFLEHVSGVEWMIASNFWEDILQLSLPDQNDEISKQSTIFISKLLEKTVHYDEDFCKSVVTKIMLPLGENIYKSIKNSNDMINLTDEVVSVYLKPTLKLIGNILEYFLEGVYFGRKDFQVLLIFLKKFHQEERISDFMIIAKTNCLNLHFAKIVFIVQFLELYVKDVTNSIKKDDAKAIIQSIKNNFIRNLSRGNFQDVADLSSFGLVFWRVVESKITSVQMEEEYFSHQFMIMLLLPSYSLLFKYCYEKAELETMLQDEFRDTFIQKCFRMMSHEVVRIGYRWREVLMNQSDIFKICYYAHDCIKSCRKYLSKEESIFMTQSFIYNFIDYVSTFKKDPSKFDVFRNELQIFWKNIDVLVILLEEFQITWKDTLESIDILTAAFDFLILHTWPTETIVKVLKLINVATAKYMAPSLALLLDSTTDSPVMLLGPMLFSKLHHENTEIKCAALEAISTVTCISNNKIEFD